MKKYLLFLIPIMVLFISCLQTKTKTEEVERLKAENDSLQQVKLELEDEVNEYFASLSQVQQNIQRIKDAQHVISVKPLSENTPEDVRTQVMEDMSYINEMIRANQEEVSRLKEKLKESNFKLGDVEKTLANLTKQLSEESIKVARLHKQLQQKDSVITELGSKVDSLDRNVEALTIKNEEKDEKIKQQDKSLHAAWYAIGSRNELKENKIITQNGIFSTKKILESDFNKNYFIKVDARNTRTIPLYTDKKANILTNHPKTSYALERQNENMVLVITKPTEFWSVSKYLVIEID